MVSQLEVAGRLLRHDVFNAFGYPQEPMCIISLPEEGWIHDVLSTQAGRFLIILSAQNCNYRSMAHIESAFLTLLAPRNPIITFRFVDTARKITSDITENYRTSPPTFSSAVSLHVDDFDDEIAQEILTLPALEHLIVRDIRNKVVPNHGYLPLANCIRNVLITTTLKKVVFPMQNILEREGMDTFFHLLAHATEIEDLIFTPSKARCSSDALPRDLWTLSVRLLYHLKTRTKLKVVSVPGYVRTDDFMKLFDYHLGEVDDDGRKKWFVNLTMFLEASES